MKKYTVIIIFILFIGESVTAAEPISVFVSIVPQRFFVQQIGKDRVNIEVMVMPGASPATYEPKPRQMAGVSKANLYFAIGVPFEKAWLKKIAASNPDMKVIHTDEGIEKIPMAGDHHHADEKHAGAQEHRQHDESGALDPHIWLSPPLVKLQARNILNALQAIDPSHGAVYKRNYDQFLADIDKVHKHLTRVFSGREGLQFMVFHPAWGYFARTYGLKEVPIAIAGKAPKPAQLKTLIHTARDMNIKLVFIQPQFSSKSARLIAREIGGQVAVADPLAEDWITNLKQIAENFKMALR